MSINVDLAPYIAAHNCIVTSLPLGVTVTTLEEETETNCPTNFKNYLLSLRLLHTLTSEKCLVHSESAGPCFM